MGFNFAEAIVPGVGRLIDYTLRDEAVKAAAAAAAGKVKGKGRGGGGDVGR